MGAVEISILVLMEASLKYHPFLSEDLTIFPESGSGTLSGGQFDWGGRLLKSNGGAQRSPQGGWKSPVECIGIRGLDCETYKSSRGESRSK